jgi:lipoprotein-anchoring transpeptidase ErfK/SrfK
MIRKTVAAWALVCAVAVPAAAQNADPFAAPRQMASASNMGGGFIEFLFQSRRDDGPRLQGEAYPSTSGYSVEQGGPAWRRQARLTSPTEVEPVTPKVDPRFNRQIVSYSGNDRPGTIVIDTSERFLFLVQEGGKAIRYGVGVGRDGFEWTGSKRITRKAEWPDWRPPEQMLRRRPDLPRFMEGGPDNPLGARALYLGSSLYRIHGSNEPETIGQAVSSGCIRMRNEDVVDLYDRVRVGTTVRVIH